MFDFVVVDSIVVIVVVDDDVDVVALLCFASRTIFLLYQCILARSAR